MFRLGQNAKLITVGIIMFGLGALTNAFGQIPGEVTMLQSELKRVIKEAQDDVANLANKCDKCSSETKTNGRKGIILIAQVADNLEKTTNSRFSSLANTCKK